MIEYITYKTPNTLSPHEEKDIVTFLYQHLEQYGDEKADIQKCMDYALGREGRPGGLVLAAKEGAVTVGAVIINYTGMDGYIPGNILVYIATHNAYRGKGIGRQLMQAAIDNTHGGIALHVEPDNPARHLYEKMGFSSKYLEMRLNK